MIPDPTQSRSALAVAVSGERRPILVRPILAYPGKLSPQQLHTILGQERAPFVLDVRNPDEFVGVRGHIAEAVLILPLLELEP